MNEQKPLLPNVVHPQGNFIGMDDGMLYFFSFFYDFLFFFLPLFPFSQMIFFITWTIICLHHCYYFFSVFFLSSFFPSIFFFFFDNQTNTNQNHQKMLNYFLLLTTRITQMDLWKRTRHSCKNQCQADIFVEYLLRFISSSNMHLFYRPRSLLFHLCARVERSQLEGFSLSISHPSLIHSKQIFNHTILFSNYLI